MTKKYKSVVVEQCIDCGMEFERAPGRVKYRCPPCRIAYHADVTEQLVRKEGPAYDKWKANLRKAMAKVV